MSRYNRDYDWSVVGYYHDALGLGGTAVQSLGLKASELDILFARTLVHCDNPPSQFWSRKQKMTNMIHPNNVSEAFAMV